MTSLDYYYKTETQGTTWSADASGDIYITIDRAHWPINPNEDDVFHIYVNGQLMNDDTDGRDYSIDTTTRKITFYNLTLNSWIHIDINGTVYGDEDEDDSSTGTTVIVSSDYTLTDTVGWSNVQSRNIDPHSSVTSDNHNKLLKTLVTPCSKDAGTNMYVDGFDITFIIDGDNILAKLTSGVCVIQNMVIQFNETTIKAFTAPSGDGESKEYYIVVNYSFKTTLPLSVATIKSEEASEYTGDNLKAQLLLYKFTSSDSWVSGQLPNAVTLKTYLDTDDNFVDCRSSYDNTPKWANKAFLRLDGTNVVNNYITLNTAPVNDTDATNKAYVDTNINSHHSVHNDYFVHKSTTNDSHRGQVDENIIMYLGNPMFKMINSNTDESFSIDTTTEDTVSFNTTEDIYSFNINGTAISQINSNGITSALWGSDIAEYFTCDDSVTKLPEQGTCVCVRNGKAFISSMINDPSAIGFVSYKPAYVLGGSTMFKMEFEQHHKIPVAIMGQLRDVNVYSDYDIDFGGFITSYRDGMGYALQEFSGNCLGKILTPIKKGLNKAYILLK